MKEDIISEGLDEYYAHNPGTLNENPYIRALATEEKRYVIKELLEGNPFSADQNNITKEAAKHSLVYKLLQLTNGMSNEGEDAENILYNIIAIKNQIVKEVDLHEIEGYEDAVKKAFLFFLKNGDFDYNIHSAIKIKTTLGEGIDFTNEIKEAFLLYLQNDYIRGMYRIFTIKYEFGEGINFSEIEGYEDAVKKAFMYHLKEVCNGCSAYSGTLDIWNKGACDIKNEFGEGINFSEIEGYEDAVKKAFLESLEVGDISGARAVEIGLGEGIDFSDIKVNEEDVKKALLGRLLALDSEEDEEDFAGDALSIKEYFSGIDFTDKIQEAILFWQKKGGDDSEYADHIKSKFNIKESEISA